MPIESPGEFFFIFTIFLFVYSPFTCFIYFVILISNFKIFFLKDNNIVLLLGGVLFGVCLVFESVPLILLFY